MKLVLALYGSVMILALILGYLCMILGALTNRDEVETTGIYIMLVGVVMGAIVATVAALTLIWGKYLHW